MLLLTGITAPSMCSNAVRQCQPTCRALSGPCFHPSARPVAQPDAAPFQAADGRQTSRQSTLVGSAVVQLLAGAHA